MAPMREDVGRVRVLPPAARSPYARPVPSLPLPRARLRGAAQLSFFAETNDGA